MPRRLSPPRPRCNSRSRVVRSWRGLLRIVQDVGEKRGTAPADQSEEGNAGEIAGSPASEKRSNDRYPEAGISDFTRGVTDRPAASPAGFRLFRDLAAAVTTLDQSHPPVLSYWASRTMGSLPPTVAKMTVGSCRQCPRGRMTTISSWQTFATTNPHPTRSGSTASTRRSIVQPSCS